jgi:hypothetical protein
MHDLKNMKPRNMGNNFVKKMKILHDYRKLFHISSQFDLFIGVDMVMCHALICVKEIYQSLT